MKINISLIRRDITVGSTTTPSKDISEEVKKACREYWSKVKSENSKLYVAIKES